MALQVHKCGFQILSLCNVSKRKHFSGMPQLYFTIHSFTSDIHQRGHPSVYPSLRVRIDSRRTHGLSGLDFFESRGISSTYLHGIYLQTGYVSPIITQTPLRLTSDCPRFHPGVLYFWFVNCTVSSVPVIKLSPVQWRLSFHTWGRDSQLCKSYFNNFDGPTWAYNDMTLSR